MTRTSSPPPANHRRPLQGGHEQLRQRERRGRPRLHRRAAGLNATITLTDHFNAVQSVAAPTRRPSSTSRSPSAFTARARRTRRSAPSARSLTFAVHPSRTALTSGTGTARSSGSRSFRSSTAAPTASSEPPTATRSSRSRDCSFHDPAVVPSLSAPWRSWRSCPPWRVPAIRARRAQPLCECHSCRPSSGARRRTGLMVRRWCSRHAIRRHRPRIS